MARLFGRVYAFSFREHIVRRQFVRRQFVRRKKDDKKISRILIYCLVILTFASGFFFRVWQKVYTIKTTYEIQQLQGEIKELGLKNKKLNIELAQLSSLQRVEIEALEKLGLSKPEVNQIKLLELEF